MVARGVAPLISRACGGRRVDCNPCIAGSASLPRELLVAAVTGSVHSQTARPCRGEGVLEGIANGSVLLRAKQCEVQPCVL